MQKMRIAITCPAFPALCDGQEWHRFCFVSVGVVGGSASCRIAEQPCLVPHARVGEGKMRKSTVCHWVGKKVWLRHTRMCAG